MSLPQNLTLETYLSESSRPIIYEGFKSRIFSNLVIGRGQARSIGTKPMDPNVSRLLDFWFDPRYESTRWFMPSADFDREIKDGFESLVHQARTPSLDHWTSQPRGTLALLLLLDQFPRNIFRDTSDSFRTDPKALEIAVRGIAKGQDRDVPRIQQSFFYLPLMHSEQLLGQVAGVANYEALVKRCEGDEKQKALAEASLAYSIRHRDVIMEFGRFPSRNKALRREETEEERQYLKEHPTGF